MEKNAEPKKGLLERLAGKAGCMYLSDLHMKNRLSYIYYAVLEIPAEYYSLSEWSDTIRYITGEEHSFCTGMEAREWLLRFACEADPKEPPESP